MSSNRLLISINPGLTCQYTTYCQNISTKAIIYTNGLPLIRWIMMPVCPQCLSAAIAMWDPKTPMEDNQCVPA